MLIYSVQPHVVDMFNADLQCSTPIYGHVQSSEQGKAMINHAIPWPFHNLFRGLQAFTAARVVHLVISKQGHGVRMLVTGPHQGFHLTLEVDMCLKRMNIYIYIYTRMNIYLYVYIYIYVHTYMYVYIYIYMYMYVGIDNM